MPDGYSQCKEKTIARRQQWVMERDETIPFHNTAGRPPSPGPPNSSFMTEKSRFSRSLKTSANRRGCYAGSFLETALQASEVTLGSSCFVNLLRQLPSLPRERETEAHVAFQSHSRNTAWTKKPRLTTQAWTALPQTGRLDSQLLRNAKTEALFVFAAADCAHKAFACCTSGTLRPKSRDFLPMDADHRLLHRQK